jgi:HD-GYP domain-containing protein (c-di-GMP phosphodiesterase class II)
MAIKFGRIRLVVTISAVFTSLIILFGLVIRQYGYYNTSRIILDSSKAQFSQVSQELLIEFRSRQDIMKQSIGILSETGVMEAETAADCMTYIPIFSAALQSDNAIAAIEVGYDSGNFFIVRKLTTPEHLKTFDAPPATRFVVDYIEHDISKGSTLQRRWYDGNLQKLKKSVFQETDYDPRIRPWYTLARKPGELVSTDPYFFLFFQATGITVSKRGAAGVIGGDVILNSLSEVLTRHPKSSQGELALLEKNGDNFYVVSHSDPEKLRGKYDQGGRYTVDHFPSPVIREAVKSPDVLSEVWHFSHDGETWIGSTRPIRLAGEKQYYLITVAQEHELLQEALLLQKRAMHFTLAMLLVTVLLTWLFARRVSQPILELAGAADKIRMFQFSSCQKHGSFIKEVDELENSMNMMQSTISKFINLISSLASEKDYSQLLQKITEETLDISGADIACTFLLKESENILEAGSVNSREGLDLHLRDLPPIPLDGTSKILDIFARGKRVVAPLDELLSLPAYRATMKRMGLKDAQIVILPLKNRQKEVIGILCFTYEKESFGGDREVDAGRMAFIEALSGFSAVTLEGRKMLKMQKRLLESFIQLIAGAIDSKSPYTGGHCQRVPVLTRMLAEKACEEKEGAFKDFDLSDDQWEELHIASWLHDCGKVTTPEYVVDKATKLETIYDRIHEIRMRFEVLKRDAHIHYFEQLIEGGTRDELYAQLQAQWAELDAEFSFVAQCNLGGEFMEPEHIERLHKIGARKWLRTLSDRLGISSSEGKRKMALPESPLPVEELLLADKEEHIILRPESSYYEEGNLYGFQLDVPQHLYNRGELYNLSISRGTLTAEERFKINDHIVQTIIMLKQLPYPKHLANVPDIAGGHHEKLDGTGYPRKMCGEDMSIPAKMMAIADIFEALTASDRPYKKAKTLSESIRILGFMVKDNHIDADLFKLFLTSGAYLEYSKEYLSPDQLDDVDIKQYL